MYELNLIPYELKAKRLKILKFRKYTAYGIIIFCFLAVIVIIPKTYLMFLTSQENTLNQKIITNSKLIVEDKKLLSDIADYKSYNDKVDLITKQKINVTDKIRNLAKYTPKDINFSSINLSKGIINLIGVTSNYNSISVLAANLQMSEVYKNSKIVNITTNDSNKSGKYQFSIVITE